MIDLVKVLVKNKIFFGQPKSTDYISHSGLSEIKRVLLSGAPYLGDEIHLHIGGEVHLRSLLFKKSKRKFSRQQETDIEGMCSALKANSFWKWLMASSVKEVETIRKIHGVNVKVILDIRGIKKLKGIGADLKTTSCKTQKAFIKSAIEKYGYLRQGWLYKEAEELDEFYFVGVQKHYPYKVFILDISDYAKEEAKVATETKFLIELFKLVGRPFVEGSSNSKRAQRGTGKETRSILRGNEKRSNSIKHTVQKRNNSRRRVQSSHRTKNKSSVKFYRT